ncbi:hypothetical protein Esi_0105_0036 [Ectocarpus siliculosus]|uniref:Uncharacterized protein n=1 Tax=Ectocarpus siliculosus TaxID=2880 RepID=D7FH50_ECTSI|nr:hypothetical protein Esi_0105_0036 [Ectocarpus siliculosus]|eukprot:CBJ28425.1 hypothetical protein Esi_0105_0036 [Ectocarpus siliculosus]
MGSPYMDMPYLTHHGTTFGGGSMTGAHVGSPVGQHPHALDFARGQHFPPPPPGSFVVGGMGQYGGAGGQGGVFGGSVAGGMGFAAGGGGFHHPGFGPGYGSFSNGGGHAEMPVFGGPGVPGPGHLPYGWSHAGGNAPALTWQTGVAGSPSLPVPKAEPGHEQALAPVLPHTPAAKSTHAPTTVEVPKAEPGKEQAPAPVLPHTPAAESIHAPTGDTNPPAETPAISAQVQLCRQLTGVASPTVGRMRKTLGEFANLHDMIGRKRQWQRFLRDVVAADGWSKTSENSDRGGENVHKPTSRPNLNFRMPTRIIRAEVASKWYEEH